MKQGLLRLLAIVPFLTVVPHALADDDENSKVYDARLEGYGTSMTLDGSSTALLWLLLVILGAITIGVLFMDAKRSHLD